ncbi:MAG: hypothetical protein M1830_003225 [Pleopsidium flavum]|nr:MAG: hypothetical protein M1830_003225 [Pleopsidium flavum]
MDSPSGYLDSQQQSRQREFDTDISHVTETQHEQIELVEDSLPGHIFHEGSPSIKSKPSVPPELASQPTKLLQRPPSAGQDLSAGFAYSKAIKQMVNYDRGPPRKQKANHNTNQSLLEHAPSPREASDPSHSSSWMDTQRLETPRMEVQDKPRNPKGLQEKRTILDGFLDGSQTLVDGHELLPEPPRVSVRMASPVGDILLPFPAANVRLASEHMPCDPPMMKPDYAHTTTHAVESNRSIPQQRSTDSRQGVPRVPKPADRPPPSVLGRKKVTKTKRKPKSRDQYTEDPAIPQPSLDPVPSEEDILNLLAHQLKKTRQNRAASLRIQDLEIQELKHDQEDLHRQLVSSEREVDVQKKRVEQYKDAISKKVVNLTKFINGLAKDHNQLRDDAKAIKERQDAVRTDGQDLAMSLRTTRTLAKNWAQRLSEHPKVPLRDAQHELDRLQGQVDWLSRQMEEASGLLATERDRTASLEAQIVRAADSHQEVKNLIDHNRTDIIGKLDDLHFSFRNARDNIDANAEADLRVKVEECLELLKNIHGSDKVLPKELQKIAVPIKALSEESAKEDGANSNNAVLTLRACIKDDITSLKQDLQAGTVLTEQLATLRESQARLTENLRGTESALTDAGERCVVLQKDQQSLLSKISSLELEAVASRCEGANLSETVDSLREVQSANAGLRGDLEKVQNELTDSQGKLQAQIENVALLQDAKETLQCRVDELQASVAAFDQQKITQEQDAAKKCDAIRLELAKAAKAAKEELVFDYENKLHGLSHQKKEADTKVEQLKANQGRHAETSSNFRSQIADLEIKTGEKERRLESLQEQLRVASEQLNAKDAEIQARKEDHAANLKKLDQAVRNAEALQARVASLQKVQGESEDGLAILHTKSEEDDKLRDRVEALCRKLGVMDAAAPLSLETLELLEQKIAITEENPPLLANTTMPMPMPQTMAVGATTGTPTNTPPNARPSHVRHPRRKASRKNLTDNMTVRVPQVLDGPETDVMFSETHRKETTVEITHRISSSGPGSASQSQRHSTQNRATVPESQSVNAIIPLSQIQAGNEYAALTSPLADLSQLFPRTPLGSQSGTKPSDSATKELRKKTDLSRPTKDGAASRKNIPVYPEAQKQAHKTATAREVPRESVTSSAKAFDLFPDFSSPSTDHIDRTNVHRGKVTSGSLTEERVSNAAARRPAQKSALSIGDIRNRQDGPGKSASRPTSVNLTTNARSQVSSMLPLAPTSNTKLSGGSDSTRGILKNPISTLSGKRRLGGVEVGADDSRSRSKRSKAEAVEPPSGVIADSQSPLRSRQSNPIRGLGAQQHSHSPRQSARDRPNPRRKRSQTSGADRYELRFRQELA